MRASWQHQVRWRQRPTAASAEADAAACPAPTAPPCLPCGQRRHAPTAHPQPAAQGARQTHAFRRAWLTARRPAPPAARASGRKGLAGRPRCRACAWLLASAGATGGEGQGLAGRGEGGGSALSTLARTDAGLPQRHTQAADMLLHDAHARHGHGARRPRIGACPSCHPRPAPHLRPWATLTNHSRAPLQLGAPVGERVSLCRAETEREGEGGGARCW